MIDNAEDFVKIMSQLNTNTKAFSMGKVDPAYSGVGRPRILFDGESTLSSKAYPFLSSYTPTANHRVLIANIGGSYVILGRIM